MDRLVYDENGAAERNLSALSISVTKVNKSSSSVEQKRYKRRNLLNWDGDGVKTQAASLFVSGGVGEGREWWGRGGIERSNISNK